MLRRIIIVAALGLGSLVVALAIGALIIGSLGTVLIGGLVNTELQRQAAYCTNSLTNVQPASINAAGSKVTIEGNKITIGKITLNREQLDNAEIILGVAISRNLSVQQAATGLATAMHESDLYNLPYGDEDSLGLFQQRPSMIVWGTAQQIMDPVHATNKFFDAMLEVPNHDELSMMELAMETQRPNRLLYRLRWNKYQWDTMALTLASNAYSNAPKTATYVNGEVQQAVQQRAGCSGVGGNVGVAIEVAKSQIGVPYKWGAENEGEGFDCSGLMRYVYDKAGVELVGNSAAIYTAGKKVARKNVIPGDLVFWDDGSRPGVTTHVAMYLGNDQIIEATTYGSMVRISPMRWDDIYVGAIRPVPEPVNFNPGANNGWVSPMGDDSFPITSHFQRNRLDPVAGAFIRDHLGTDFGAPYGTPVYAIADGIVTFARYDGGRGNQVRINHGGGVWSVSAHLQGFAPGIAPGTRVGVGDLIGYVGNSGRSNGAHLHLEIRHGGENGTAVDPLVFLGDKGVRP